MPGIAWWGPQNESYSSDDRTKPVSPHSCIAQGPHTLPSRSCPVLVEIVARVRQGDAPVDLATSSKIL